MAVNFTQELVGSTFVTASVIEYGGRKCLVFPFAVSSVSAAVAFLRDYPTPRLTNGLPSRIYRPRPSGISVSGAFSSS